MASSSCWARCWPGAFSSLLPGHPALGFLLALVLAPLVVGAIALLAERLVLRRLNYDPEATIVATIGLLYIFEQPALIFYGPEARAGAAPFDFPRAAALVRLFRLQARRHRRLRCWCCSPSGSC